MRTTTIERKIANLTLANGNFDSIMNRVDYTFLNEFVYRAKKTSIKKFIPLIGAGAMSMQTLLVLFIVLVAKNIPVQIPHMVPPTKSVAPTDNPTSEPANVMPSTSAIPASNPTTAIPGTNAPTSAVPATNPTGATPGTGTNTFIPPAWDSLPTWKQFYSFEFNNYRYFGPEYLTNKVDYVEESLIKEEIGSLKLETDYQSHLSEEHHEINVIINRIDGISQDYAVAVRFENETGSFLYRNATFFEECHLEQYLDKSGLKKYATFEKLVYKTTEQTETKVITNKYTLMNDDSDLAWNLFNNNSSTPNIYNNSQPFTLCDLMIYMKLEKLGYNSQISIFKNGLTRFSFATKNTFMLNENDVKVLLDYLVTNGDIETTITSIGEPHENQNGSTYITSGPGFVHD